MKKDSLLTLAAVIVSLMLMATAPGNGWINDDPGGKPWPKEVNNGEPSMEKVYFSNFVDLKYGNSNEINVNWSKPKNTNKAKYFNYNNAIYYWYEWPSAGSRVPEVGLCRWVYLYDLDHEW